MSIGVLGFVVWSHWVAFPVGDNWVINFAICWNSLVSMGTFKCENFIGYAQSAGNLSFLPCLSLFNLAREDGGVSGSSDSSIIDEEIQGASEKK